ncbi:MAG: DUF885 domain-containing protein [Acidobacteriota bacterium]
MRTLILLLALPLVLQAAPQTQDEAPRELWKLFEEEWEYRLKESPIFASSLGDKRYNDRWPDISLAAFERRHRHDREVLEKLKKIDYESLSAADQLNYRLFQDSREMEVEGFQYRGYLIPLDQRGGVQTDNEVADYISFSRVTDYEDWVARLQSFPGYMDQTIVLMKEGIRLGMLHPSVIMERVPDQIDSQIVEDPTASPFFKPFESLSIPNITEAERDRLIAEARQAISQQVVPAFKEFSKFFQEEYLTASYDQVGAWQRPQGRQMYAYLTRAFTTTDLTPEQIHQIGQNEVRRIRGQMEKIIRQVDFQGSFDEFLHFLRTDPRFYYETPEELLEAYRAISKRIDPTLVRLFGKLPRMPYGVQPIPDNIAPDTTTAYYRPPSADGSRAGTYFVNLYQPETRPKYEMEALSVHEAVPGHHLQIALAMELSNFPNFRRYDGYTAFVEGWGLYSESLGEELGLYQDPYSKFGQLTYEMWRAVRLVVDTGMHHFKWTRQQSIDFFKSNAAKSEQDIVNEIDRYIAWPGQALAYKMGELKLKELRALAEKELGERFDIRAFHDTVLGNGAVPLDVLEAKVKEWMGEVKHEK